jgi:tRNA 2-thiouridine synthesizing protein B
VTAITWWGAEVILHTLSVSPRHPGFGDCLLAADTGDTILLLGDAVYAALEGSEACREMQEHSARVVALDTDVRAAGVTSAFVSIDMAGFVALTEYYPRQLAWY